MRPKPSHRPIRYRHRHRHVARRARGVATGKHVGHAGGLAFVHLDEQAHGGILQRAAQLLCDGAG